MATGAVIRSWPLHLSLRRAGSSIAFVILGAVLVDCAAVVAVREPSHRFHPHVADVGPQFRVVDDRPPESRASRQIDAMWIYGDEQFSPHAVAVVADRFAQAFPKTRPEATLVITELEVTYLLATGGKWQGACTVWADCLFTVLTSPLGREMNRRRNVVTATVRGNFDGTAFSGRIVAEYESDSPSQQENRVLRALQGAIDQALTEVHERRNPRSPAPTDRATPPELPRPWYMPTPPPTFD